MIRHIPPAEEVFGTIRTAQEMAGAIAVMGEYSLGVAHPQSATATAIPLEDEALRAQLAREYGAELRRQFRCWFGEKPAPSDEDRYPPLADPEE